MRFYDKDDYNTVLYDNNDDGISARMIVNLVSLGILALFLIISLFKCFYTVNETESAIITTFGQAQVVEDKGLHFKIPYIQKLTKVDTTVKGFPIGYIENEDGTYSEVDEDSIMITNDFNLLDIDFYISYQISDPIKYIYGSNNPEAILKDISMSSIRGVVSAYSVDSAITTGKTGIQSAVKDLIIENLESADIGLTLVDAAIQDVEPPVSTVNDAFKNVETAKQGKESAINEANAYRNQKIPEAEAKADKIKQDALATKTARINEAKGQVARFNEEFEEYIKYPLITKQRMFYETMQDVMPDLKIVIDDSESGNLLKHYTLDSLKNVTVTQ